MSKTLDLFTANAAAHALADATMSQIATESDFRRETYRQDAERYLRKAASALGYDLVRKSDEVAA